MGGSAVQAELASRDDGSAMSDEFRDSPQGDARVARASADMPTPATAGTRDLRLDLFRGIALFLIFIDHIPGNVLSHFTIQSIGFSDAAEVFIYISGYTAALVYGRRILERGMFIATVKILHRVWQLYVAHIFILVIFTALVAYNSLAFDQTAYGKALRVAKFFAEPYIAVIRVSVLGYFLFTEWSDSLTAQLAVNIAGVAMMIGAGSLISWYRTIDSGKAAAAGRDGYHAERSQDIPRSPLPRDAGRRGFSLMPLYTAISCSIFGGKVRPTADHY